MYLLVLRSELLCNNTSVHHNTRRYPAFRSQSLNVSKHVAVLSELARLVDVYHLLDVSQFEQELACADDHVLHYRELMEKLSSSRYHPIATVNCSRVQLFPADQPALPVFCVFALPSLSFILIPPNLRDVVAYISHASVGVSTAVLWGPQP